MASRIFIYDAFFAFKEKKNCQPKYPTCLKFLEIYNYRLITGQFPRDFTG